MSWQSEMGVANYAGDLQSVNKLKNTEAAQFILIMTQRKLSEAAQINVGSQTGVAQTRNNKPLQTICSVNISFYSIRSKLTMV